MLTPINAILGSLLLVAGRKLFWLLIGIFGFISGVQLASRFSGGPEWLAILVGLIFGIVFAALAIFFQKIAIWIAGFLAGGYGLSILTGMLDVDAGRYNWLVYFIGGIIGIVLVGLLFDWAIITMSSFAGASLVTRSLLSEIEFAQWILFVLFIAGILIQGYILRREKGYVRPKAKHK
jgi:hypothetical protein